MRSARSTLAITLTWAALSFCLGPDVGECAGDDKGSGTVEDAELLGEGEAHRMRQHEFVRQHTDSFGHVRPELWEQGVKQAQRMKVASALGGAASAGGAAAGGVAGMQWWQIGPAPLRLSKLDYFQGAGPISGEVVDIAIDPRGTTDQIIYIATNDGGIWKSTNGGASWNPKTDFMPSLSMGAVALDPGNPSIVYAGTGNLFDGGLGFTKGVGIYKSLDDGESWSLLNPGSVFSNVGINRIVLPASNLLLVATSAGLFRSVDGGFHFGSNAPAFDNGLAVFSGYVTDLDLDTATPTTLYASVNKQGILRSTDSGVTFSVNLFNNPGAPTPPFRFIAFAQSKQPNNLRMYASVQGDKAEFGGFAGLFSSTDGGAHWGIVPAAAERGDGCQCGFDQTLAVDPQDANRLYMGFQRLWQSTDGGGSFRNLSGNDLQIHVDHHALTFAPPTHVSGSGPTRFYVGTDGGISRTSDAGLLWANLNEGIASMLFFGIDIGRGSASNDAFTYGVTQDTGTVVRRANLPGLDWAYGTSADGTSIAVDPCNAQRAFTVSNYYSYLLTTDGGVTWSWKKWNYSGDDLQFLILGLAVDPNCNAVYANAWEQFYRSTDGGESFVPMHKFPDDVRAIATFKLDSNVMWIGLKDGTVQYTGDALAGAGATWSGATVTGALNQPVSGLFIDPTNSSEVVVVYPGFCGAACAVGQRTRHVFRTTDRGTTWADIGATDGGDPTQNLPDLPLHSVVIYEGTTPHTIIVSSDAGVMQSGDSGATWQVLGAGLPTVLSTSLAIDQAFPFPILRVGTYGRSVFELRPPLGPLPACDEATTIPAAGGVFTGTTAGAGTLSSPCGGAGPEKVFRWTPDVSGIATIETCGAGTDFDTVLSVRAPSCQNGVQIDCNDDACTNAAGKTHASRMSLTVTAGQAYFVVVDGWGSASGNFALTVTPPAAACHAATVLPAAGGVFTGTTAGHDTLQGTCGGSGPEKVFQWTPNASGTAIIDTCKGATYETLLSIREGDCANGTQVACNWLALCPGGLFASRIWPQVVAGQTYYIIVDGAEGQSGGFTLSVVPPEPIATPVPTTTPTATATATEATSPAPTHFPTPTTTGLAIPTPTVTATGTATPTRTSTPTPTASHTSTATPTTVPTPTQPPTPGRLSSVFGGHVYLGTPARKRPLVDVRVELQGADDPESPGVLLAQTRTDVDGQFSLTSLVRETGAYAYYNLMLTHPQVEVTDVEPGTGGEERSQTWISFPPPHGQASLDTAWYVAYPPPRLVVDLSEPVAAIKGSPKYGIEPIQPIDFKLDGVELTQAIQCFDTSKGDPNCADNSLPLVAGKLTVARVYISRVGPPPDQPQYPAVRVDLFVLAFVPGAPLPVVSTASQLYKVRLEWNRMDATTTANFLISAPAAGPLYAWATVNADNKWPDPDPSNNTSAPTVAAVITTRAAKINWVRVNYKPDPSTKYPTSPFKGPNLASEDWVTQHSLDVARWVYPTAMIDYQKLGTGVVDYYIEVPADPSWKTYKKITPDLRDDFVVNGKTYSAMNKFLDELFSRFPSKQGYDSLIAWFPQGTTESPLGDAPDGVAQGAPPVMPNGAGWIALGPEPMAKIGAHEIAHNYGLGHYPCSMNAPGWDHPWPAPYNDCWPIEVPFDPFIMDVNNSMTFMTYGGDSTAPPEWKFLISKLQGGSGARTSVVASDVPVMFIRGWLSTNGEGGFYPLYTLAAEPSVPEASDQALAEVRFVGASRQTIARYPFDLQLQSFEAGPSDVGAFQWYLPRPDGLDRVQLLYGGAVASERQASAHEPQAAWVSPPPAAVLDGSATLTWQASDDDQEPLFFMVSYSNDGGTTWTPLAVNLTDRAYALDTDQLPGGDACVVRVLVSDGWYTRQVVGGPFHIRRKPPEVAISTPGDENQLNEEQAYVFTGWASDPEDGSLAGAALSWSSDRDGQLGTGATLVVPGLTLTPGPHVISLTAKDGDGLESRASAHIVVRRTVSCAGDCSQDGTATVDELLAMVNIALGGTPVFECPAGDVNGDGQITIDEILTAVNAALNGCE